MSINDNGQIVGSADWHACLFDPTGGGANINLGTSRGYPFSFAESINESGQIVGRSWNWGSNNRACLFDPTGGGANIDLGTLGGPWSSAWSINDRGQIVGLGYTSSGYDEHACIFDPTGGGANIDLGTLSGYPFSGANSINNNGQIVGYVADSSWNLRPCLFDSTGGGANIDLGTLAGYPDGRPSSINDNAQIVGAVWNSSGDVRACLFDPTGGGANIDLNTLIDPSSGWILRYANSINNNGSIIGSGINPDGYTRAFLLIPEPAAVPPVVSAGDNIEILSTEQSYTVIKGNATDQDEDTLQYRWLDGPKVILDWSPVGENGEAYLNLGSLPYLSVGNHTLTLEVREAKEGGLAASDEMILTVQNSPPQAQPAPSHQVVEIGIDAIVVVADVADSDGDTVTYQWLKGSEVLASGSVQTVQGGASVQIPDLVIQAGDERFPVGLHQIELTVSDGINDPVSAIVTVEVKDTKAPSLIPMPSVTILWPPNHELQPVTIAANAFDNGGGTITLGATVQSSEPPDITGDGSTIPDYYIDSLDDQTGLIQLRLRSERAGTGNGRTYTITITATDASGNSSVATVVIRAPHDKRKK